jgi:TRAP-type C4-dicarboxylate transport system permease small subunit
VDCPFCGAKTEGVGEPCPKCKGKTETQARLPRVIARIEEIAVSILLGAMIFLVLIQIILRNFLSTGITGGAEMVRHMVLWIAFLGAAMAARDAKHIRIDVALRIFTPRWRIFAEAMTGLFTAVVCGILMYAAIQFNLMDYHSGTVIAFFNTPVWFLELIIPIGYLIVMIWFVVRCGESFWNLIRERNT